MAEVDRKPKGQSVETQRTSGSVLPPVYHPKDHYEYVQNRFMRAVTFVIVGGAVGLVVGLALGGISTLNMDLPMVNKTAFSLSMGVAGTIIGMVGGVVVENMTTSTIDTPKI